MLCVKFDWNWSRVVSFLFAIWLSFPIEKKHGPSFEQTDDTELTTFIIVDVQEDV